MATIRYPSLYQINTRVWLTELAQKLRRPATLDDIPDAELDRLVRAPASTGFGCSAFGKQVPRLGRFPAPIPSGDVSSRKHSPICAKKTSAVRGLPSPPTTCTPVWAATLPCLACVCALQKRGLKLMLDFVPNHMGLGHPWVNDHPEHFIEGNELDLAHAPQNYVWAKRQSGDLLLAHGRDPYFPGWPDTLQLNYARPETQEAMIGELCKIAGQCDGVRCDMAMLVLPEVFERTWGKRAPLFWPKATARVRDRVPGFLFMAEVYWDLEWTLQQQGFDYAYDKRLYDRLREGHARPVREHFHAGLDYQDKLARFLENHDEPRAAATFSPEVHRAAAVITFLSPGLRFFHQGQFEGRKKRISPHLVRAPEEPVDAEIKKFYDRLLGVLRHPIIREGQWQLLDCAPGWEGNGTNDCFLVFAWRDAKGETLLAAVNYAANQSQCHVRLPFADLAGKKWQLQDQLSPANYAWNGDDLLGRGLYLDMTPWQAVVFTIVER